MPWWERWWQTFILLWSFFSPTFTPSVNSKSKTEKPVTTEAQQPNLSEISKCRAENDKEARLNCYDKLFPQDKAVQAESKLEKATDVGKWHIHYYIANWWFEKCNFIVRKWWLYQNSIWRSGYPTLFIACREKKTEVFLSWDVYLGLEQTSMLYRLDKQKAVERNWLVSTDTKAVFYKGNDIDFIRKLANSNKMYTKITPYNESPVSATFNLNGLSNAKTTSSCL